MRQVPPAYTPVPPAALLRLVGSSRGAGEAIHELLVARHGTPRIALVGSGTQALTLGISALAGPGGSVALPGWGCYDLASAAVGAGVGVRLYDLDPETLQPDRDALARVAGLVDVVVVVSFFGIPVESDRLSWTTVGAGPALIHDAAQAHGTVFAAGSIDEKADTTVLSFGRGKGWTGLGGGALLLRSERARQAVEAGVRSLEGGPAVDRLGMGVRGVAQWLLGRPAVYGVPARLPALGLGETRYHPPRPVQALTEASAAVLLASCDAADTEARYRRERAAVVLDEAKGGSVVRAIRTTPGAEAGYLRLPALDVGGADRAAGRLLGVVPSYPTSLADVDPLKPLLLADDPLPGSRRLATSLLTLPTHSQMSKRDQARLRAWLTAQPSTLRP